VQLIGLLASIAAVTTAFSSLSISTPEKEWQCAERRGKSPVKNMLIQPQERHYR
jgi:hypothetical protein